MHMVRKVNPLQGIGWGRSKKLKNHEKLSERQKNLWIKFDYCRVKMANISNLGSVISNIDDIEKGAQVATSLLQQRANDVRANRVNWQSYVQGQMISQEDYNLFINLIMLTVRQSRPC